MQNRVYSSNPVSCWFAREIGLPWLVLHTPENSNWFLEKRHIPLPDLLTINVAKSLGTKVQYTVAPKILFAFKQRGCSEKTPCNVLRKGRLQVVKNPQVIRKLRTLILGKLGGK